MVWEWPGRKPAMIVEALSSRSGNRYYFQALNKLSHRLIKFDNYVEL